MRIYLACFDIEDDRNRRRLSKLLLRYGDRVQYSVFELSLKSEKQLEQLRQRCLKHLEVGDDLRFYWITREGGRKSFDAQGNRLAQYPAAVVL